MFLRYTLIVLFSVLFCATHAQNELGPVRKLFRVKKIKVEGLKKVELEAILDKLAIEKGQRLDNYTLRKAISRIYALKYFEYVEAHQRKGGILVFKVKEKPIISNIVFKGNSELDREDLMAKVKTREFAILDINTIKNDVLAIQKEYEEKGYYLAKVSYRFKTKPNGNLELVYDIKEYDKVMVKKITFLGNKSFKDDELKGIMMTREEGLFSFMSGSGNFKEFDFQTDIERLKYFYKTKGHLQVNVGTPEITVSEDKKWVFITVKVTEGPQFSVNNVFFQGEILFTDTELREGLTLKSGEIYSEELIRQDIQKLTEMYQDKGYAFANVLRTLQVVPGENKVDVEYSFEKGKIAYFGNITVKGNTKTRDKVVRRELRIHEGMKFSGSKLRRSKENVNRLGFFEPNSVIFNTVSPQGSDDVLDVEIQVKERNTGQISVGAGYSTANNFFLQASIAQNNFRGLGQNLSFSLSLSDVQQNFNIGFTEPYLFDSLWTGGGDLFHRKTEIINTGASWQNTGFNFRVGYPIFDYTRLFASYRLEKTKIQDVQDPTIDEDVENGIASSVRLTLLRDTRNNMFEPSKGYFLSASTEYAGIGFDQKWFRNELDARYYKKIIGDLVFRTRFFASKLETVDGQAIPRSQKFALGGPRNMRGYDIEAIGPKETAPDDLGRPRTFNTRDLFSTFTTIELEHPLAREAGLKWVIFADAGHVGRYDNIKLFKDYGFGFRWFSPIGVLRFEFGFPLDEINDPGFDNGSQFHFDIGQLF